MTKTEEGAQVESGPEAGKEAEVRTITDSYSGQENLGWTLHKPTAVSTELQAGKLSTRTTAYEASTGDVRETTTPAGASESQIPLYASQFGRLGTEAGQLDDDRALALDASGDVWVADSGNDRIDEFSASGVFTKALGWGVSDGKEKLEKCTSSCKAGIAGSGAGQLTNPQGIAYDLANEDLYVSDTASNRIEVFTTAGAFVRAFGWGVSNGKEELQTCTNACKAGLAGSGKGQLSSPKGLAVASGGDLLVADSANSRIEVFSPEGAYLNTYGKAGTGNGEFSGVSGVTQCGADIYATDDANRVQELSSEGKYLAQFGSPGKKNGQFTQIAGIACDPKNNDLYVTDQGANRVEVFTSSGAFVGAFAWAGSGEGELSEPTGIAVSQAGATYLADSANSRVEQWTPGLAAAHTSQIIYYTAGANSYSECAKHPEWANLPCRGQPAAQPEDGLPKLPETVTTYNVYDEPLSETTTVGSEKRTTTTTYDEAGRTLTSSVTSTKGKAQPTVADEYDKETGQLIKQSTTEGKSLTSEYNTLGQLVSYTDADGVTSTYKYDIDGRMTEAFDGKGTQTYSYNSTTGLLDSVKDSAAGTFTATYNPEGKIETQTYPGGMKATYAYNSAGQAISVTYTKGTSKWYEDSVSPSIHGQWLAQESTLSSETYVYDPAGRLTEATETPQGKGCTTHQYTYDEDSNRTSETTTESSSSACSTAGGTSVSHAYDTADRLMDPGTQYEPFGANTVLPAADAGGHALESSYYAGGALYNQTQNAKTNTYALDPAGRVLETTSESMSGTTSTISHYSGAGTTPAWTETVGGTGFSRNITGITGSLCAIQTASEVTIQITNLHGDVIGTVLDKDTAKPTLSSEPTAFGVPTTSSESKYGWLGGAGLAVEFESGIASNSGGSYVPQLGIHLAPASISPSALQDPINEYLANRSEAEPVPGFNGESPNGINPLPVNEQAMKAFWENPPWDKPPGTEEGGEDPWVLTGAQALEWAKAFYAESLSFSAQAVACNKVGNTSCGTHNEVLAEFYGLASEMLEGCHSAVHNGRHNKYDEYENGVCWISWEFTIGHEPTNLSVEQCWSYTRYEFNEWYCPDHGWRQLGKVI